MLLSESTIHPFSVNLMLLSLSSQLFIYFTQVFKLTYFINYLILLTKFFLLCLCPFFTLCLTVGCILQQRIKMFSVILHNLKVKNVHVSYFHENNLFPHPAAWCLVSFLCCKSITVKTLFLVFCTQIFRK